MRKLSKMAKVFFRNFLICQGFSWRWGSSFRLNVSTPMMIFRVNAWRAFNPPLIWIKCQIRPKSDGVCWNVMTNIYFDYKNKIDRIVLFPCFFIYHHFISQLRCKCTSFVLKLHRLFVTVKPLSGMNKTSLTHVDRICNIYRFIY